MQKFYPLFAYVLGSIPFGLILSKIFGNGNLKKLGSKNIGATNVFRTQGKAIGSATFVLDFMKGFVACYFLKTWNASSDLLTIAAPIIGHIFPIWLGFKGGKGVATYFGVLCSLSSLAFCGTIAVWVFVFFITKISAVSGIASVVSSIIIFYCVEISSHLNFINQLYVLIGLVVLIIFKHHENIKRLIKNKV